MNRTRERTLQMNFWVPDELLVWPDFRFSSEEEQSSITPKKSDKGGVQNSLPRRRVYPRVHVNPSFPSPHPMALSGHLLRHEGHPFGAIGSEVILPFDNS